MVSGTRYFQNVWDTLKTTLVGMSITGKYLMRKPITVQYPDERMPIPDRYRGIHYLEQEKCINCLACARACPIDCIEMDAVRHGKELEWVSFTLDYQKCMFCELCVYPCPKDCIHQRELRAHVYAILGACSASCASTRAPRIASTWARSSRWWSRTAVS